MCRRLGSGGFLGSSLYRCLLTTYALKSNKLCTICVHVELWWDMFKGIVCPIMKIYVINYTPSCRSKPVRPLLILWTKITILLIKFESFWPCIDFQGHVTFSVQHHFLKAMRILFVLKKTKNNVFFQTISSLPCQSLMHMHERTRPHNAHKNGLMDIKNNILQVH